MKKLLRLLLAVTFIPALNAAATVLTFERINYNPPNCAGLHVIFPANYGDRVTFDSYVPPGWESTPDHTWFYGSGGGHTPNIVADYKVRNDGVPPVYLTLCPVGDLYAVLRGADATSGEQFIEVSLTADPGYLVHLESFNIANMTAPEPLPHLQVTNGSGAVLFAASSVPILGGPAGTHSTFNNAGTGWTAQKLVIRLDAPYDGVSGHHISQFGIDDIQFSQTTCSALSLDPAALHNSAPGAAYSQTVTASGGSSPYTFAVTSGALPGGLTLSTDGVLSGTPTSGGDFTFTITATDASGCTGLQSYTVQVICPAVTLDPATLPNSAPGAAYNQTVTASGGTAPYTVAVTSGTLPGGLTLSSGGLLSGTPSSGGGFTFTITAADANGCTGFRSYTVQILQLTISCPPAQSVQCLADVPPAALDASSFLALGGTLSGGCGPLTVTHLGDVPTGTCPKTITRTYRATDTCGQTADCAQTITVQDTIAPMIGAAGPNRVTECDGTPPVFTPPTATDNCDPAPTMEVVSDVRTDEGCANSYSRTITWRFRDACGNPSASVSQTIKVHDTQPPVADTVAGSLDRTVEAGDSTAIAAAYALPPPTFTDACQGPVAPLTPTVASVADGSCATGSAVERRWHAVDACGNASLDFVQRITFVDTTPPTLTCPDNKMILTGPGPVTFTATAEDDIDPAPSITFSPPSGSTFAMGATPVTCRATDRCGNTRTCTFNVTVTAFGCTAAEQQAFVKASNARAGSLFGYSVAVGGNTMVVGTPFEDSNATGVNGDQNNTSAPLAGAAYVFVRSGSTWSQQAYLKAFNTDSGDGFGRSVAVSGETVVVGAPYESSGARVVNGNQGDNSALGAGSAYVFVRAGSTWSQQAYLKASNARGGPDAPSNGDNFGWSVAISGDIIVIGAVQEASAGTGVNGDQDLISAPQAGAAYVFTRVEGTWEQQAYLKASNTDREDRFGESVAVSGNAIVVGAPYANSPGGTLTGAAYVFVRSGGSWSQQALLSASNADGWQPCAFCLPYGDAFGYAVAISDDTLVVGAPLEDSGASGVNGDQDDNGDIYSGAAYVFSRVGTTWSQAAYLKASDNSLGSASSYREVFGGSVAVDGGTVVVGSYYPYPAGFFANNSAYVFIGDKFGWREVNHLRGSRGYDSTHADPGDLFGTAVALAGETVVAGAKYDERALYSGAAYVFQLANEPCAHDDFFTVPVGSPVVIPVSAFLANDAHSRASPLSFAGNDPATALGTVITSIGSPVTALSLPSPPPLPPGVTEDTFMYRVTDGTHEAIGTVHLRPAVIPAPPINTLSPTGPLLGWGSGPTILFNAPTAGTYVLERMPLADFGLVGAVWTEIARQMPSGPGVVAFADGLLPGGAAYRVRSVP